MNYNILIIYKHLDVYLSAICLYDLLSVSLSVCPYAYFLSVCLFDFAFNMSITACLFVQCIFIGTAESVMCDVTKICLKRKDERRSGIEYPFKKWIIDVFFDVSHDTFHCPFFIYLSVKPSNHFYLCMFYFINYFIKINLFVLVYIS